MYPLLSQYLSMDMVTCSPHDSVDKVKSVFVNAFQGAHDRGQSTLILVQMKSEGGQKAIEILDFLDKVFYYYDIPVGFTARDRMDQVWSLTQFYSVDFSKSRIDV